MLFSLFPLPYFLPTCTLSHNFPNTKTWISISAEMQSQGIGKILLNYVKGKRNKLILNVYQKNTRAISFYQREGFEIQYSGLDEATGEKDYVMAWQQK